MGFRLDLNNEIGVNVMQTQIYPAKKKALKMLEVDLVVQCAAIWDYANTLKESTPGTIVIFGVEDDNRFSKFYVCFQATKTGWIEDCRPVIGVDGCHLKESYGGVLLL